MFIYVITSGYNDPVIITVGNFIVMSADISHGLVAAEKLKMLSVVVKGE